MRFRRAARRFVFPALAAALTGCSLAPAYEAPATTAPPAFKESGLWQAASPADKLERGAWWRAFGDARLDTYESELQAANPTLAQALARYDTARALAREAGSEQFPTLTAGGQITRNRQSDERPLRGANQPDVYSADTLGAGAAYELDLWGRVRNLIAAGRAEAQGSAADLESVRLSLEATLADDYVRLETYDSESALLSAAVEAYKRASAITNDRFKDGLVSDLDVSRAETQLQSTEAQLADLAARRALIEHAIATLTGAPASRFSIPPSPLSLTLPNFPAGLPSTLLERRPDVAAAQRRAAAANARIGVARAAFFPRIDLAAAGGWQSTALADLTAAGDRYWLLGPEAALTLFDGGLRKARVAAARAEFDEASAAYKAKVLTAFQDVEDDLALLNHLAIEADHQSAAVKAAQRSEATALARYEEGASTYLDVVTAQAASLQARRSELDIKDQRLEAAVNLVRAVGGGWASQDLPQNHSPRETTLAKG